MLGPVHERVACDAQGKVLKPLSLLSPLYKELENLASVTCTFLFQRIAGGGKCKEAKVEGNRQDNLGTGISSNTFYDWNFGGASEWGLGRK